MAAASSRPQCINDFLYQAEEEEAPVVAEKSLFSVKLVKFDAAKKVALIKEIKNQVEGLNLVQVSLLGLHHVGTQNL